MAKRLAIITWDAASAQLYASQVRDFFGDQVNTRCYSTQLQPDPVIEPADVYLVSTCAFADRDIGQLLPSRGPVVLSEVRVTRDGLERLLAIPRNTRALLVNLNQPMATETIATLNQLGVTNIQFIPYYPGAPEPSHVPLAITTGERRFVPEWAAEVIDLGPRLLSGSTFLELAHQLKCESALDGPAFKEYLASLAEQSYGIEQMLQRSVQMESLFELFEQALDAGLIGVDGEGMIFACSPKVEDILSLPAQQLLERRAQQALPFLPFAESLSAQKAIHSRLVEIHGNPVSVSIHSFYRGGSSPTTFCVLQRFQDEERRQQKIRRQLLGKGHVTKYTFDSIIGDSPCMVSARQLARRMATSNASILISGESGTGKELFAHAIHAASPRANEPFVAINCAAIPDALLESQLFGYEEGAFTGAKKGGHIGFFEAARSGTLFLDEIEAMSPMLQVKLLRVLQEKEIVRLGGVDVIHVDVRIIAASNVDLNEEVHSGRFRRDLFYRLSVLPLQLPPLRQRGGDVLLLLRRIQEGIGARFELSPATAQLLLRHPWEGNVRELRNCVEYLAYLEKPLIEPEDLPVTLRAAAPHTPAAEPAQAAELRRLAGDRLQSYLFLLEQLAASRSLGRQALEARAAAAGLALSQQNIRTMAAQLEQLGLVSIQKGRSGTCITPRGLELLAELTRNPQF